MSGPIGVVVAVGHPPGSDYLFLFYRHAGVRVEAVLPVFGHGPVEVAAGGLLVGPAGQQIAGVVRVALDVGGIGVVVLHARKADVGLDRLMPGQGLDPGDAAEPVIEAAVGHLVEVEVIGIAFLIL